MKKNKPKYLEFYMECSRIRRMKVAGLCHLFGQVATRRFYPEFRLISPSKEERDFLMANGFNPTWWGSGTYHNEVHKFTPLRQNIVLLMAALNNEL